MEKAHPDCPHALGEDHPLRTASSGKLLDPGNHPGSIGREKSLPQRRPRSVSNLEHHRGVMQITPNHDNHYTWPVLVEFEMETSLLLNRQVYWPFLFHFT